MLIDWFTLCAQIVNFIVLVWLLKKFLWGKLIRTIDEREDRIASRLKEADQKNKGAEQQLAAIQARAVEQERERGEMIEQAQREAAQLRLELTQQARDSVHRQETEWREDLEREKMAFLDEVRQRAGVEILSVVRRALTELASADIQRCAVEVFLERLQSADQASLQELAAAGTIQVLSASDLPADLRQRIDTLLTARFGDHVRLEFARNPQMTWGIELRSKGRSIAWTPESYLESLDEGLRKALELRPKVLVG